MDPAILAALLCFGFLVVALGGLAFALLRSNGKAKDEDEDDPQEEQVGVGARLCARIAGPDEPCVT